MVFIAKADGTGTYRTAGSSFNLKFNYPSNVNVSGSVKKLISSGSKKWGDLKNQRLNSSSPFAGLKKTSNFFQSSKKKSAETEREIHSNNEKNIYYNESASLSSASLDYFVTACSTPSDSYGSSKRSSSFQWRNGYYPSTISSIIKRSFSKGKSSASTTFSSTSTLLNNRSQSFVSVNIRDSSNSALEQENGAALNPSHSQVNESKKSIIKILSGVSPEELEWLLEDSNSGIPEEWHKDIKRVSADDLELEKKERLSRNLLNMTQRKLEELLNYSEEAGSKEWHKAIKEAFSAASDLDRKQLLVRVLFGMPNEEVEELLKHLSSDHEALKKRLDDIKEAYPELDRKQRLIDLDRKQLLVRVLFGMPNEEVEEPLKHLSSDHEALKKRLDDIKEALSAAFDLDRKQLLIPVLFGIPNEEVEEPLKHLSSDHEALKKRLDDIKEALSAASDLDRKQLLVRVFFGMPNKEVEEILEKVDELLKKKNELTQHSCYRQIADAQALPALKKKEISYFKTRNIKKFNLNRLSKSILRPISSDQVFKLLKAELQNPNVDNDKLFRLAEWISKESVKKSPIKSRLTKNVQTGETLQLLNDAERIAGDYKNGICDLSGGHFSKLPENDVFSPEIQELNLRNNPSLTTLRSYLQDKEKLRLVDLTNTPKLKADDTTADIVTALRVKGCEVNLDASLAEKLGLKQTVDRPLKKLQKHKKINIHRFSTFSFNPQKIESNPLSSQSLLNQKSSVMNKSRRYTI